MIRILLLLFFVAGLFACSKKAHSGAGMANPNNETKTFLALGDSYTIGESVAVTDRFPAQTAALLRQDGLKIADPVYIARTGWTTTNLQQAINAQNLAPNYDIVTLLIGVNDQYQRMDTSGYTSRFTQLLQKAIELARGNKRHVFVVSIPDYSVTPFVPASDKQRVSTEVDWFNRINKRITESFGVSYTDITPSSREGASNPSLIANDGLHPSGLEYRKWAQLLAPKIKAVLQ
jgi:lysophospholipase L1-like esterase